MANKWYGHKYHNRWYRDEDGTPLAIPEYCDNFDDHEWEPGYYGLHCKHCDMFIPDGQGPWMPWMPEKTSAADRTRTCTPEGTTS